ncbi:CRISPR-associated protein Cse4 [Clostridium estertheticum]|uniref:CRISPR-associated protein Cse4 n=1 Tax=Clostridium estertheticum TaxID=238834 RepID=UPI001CF59A29|nr:CRISPR-associated protein Cse4 [Clostridium estertheticum]MCB2358688.1 CRISPR-associated protein Cse4 [Clostridium estertheticum]
MIKGCLESFKEMYDEKGEKLITDSYVLGEGSYVLVDEHGEIVEILEVDKKNSDKTGRYYEFAEMDYLSKLVSMDKPVDQKKVIHSNNFLSFFVKKENISNGKLTDDIIENYYKNLSDPRIKYKDKEKKRMYELLEEKYGKSDIDSIEKQKAWIKSNIFSILNKLKNNKSYLKVFLKADIEEYKKESEKYVVPNIYNNTQFNVKTEKSTYGLPNDNMGLNQKKPYLDNKTRKNSTPYLVSLEEVILQKKFFDYLYNNVCEGKTNIYISDGYIKCLSNNENLDDKFSGYFLRVKKGKEVEIHDFDIIVGLDNKLKGLFIDTIILIDYTKFKGLLSDNYGEIKDISTLKMLISDIYFNKFLTNNYFSDPKDIKLNDFRVKENLIKSRGAFFNWFYKGDTIVIKQIFDKTSMELIKNAICNEYMIKAKEQFNLRCGILDYLIGGEKMADILNGLASSLREKINNKQTDKIESDNEYYFAVGQISSYLLSKSKSSKKVHSLINPLLNCKTDEKLKLQLQMLFKKYNYDIQKESKRFNNFSAMVLGYQTESKVDDNMLVAGYLYSSLIYESKKEGEVKDGE